MTAFKGLLATISWDFWLFQTASFRCPVNETCAYVFRIKNLQSAQFLSEIRSPNSVRYFDYFMLRIINSFRPFVLRKRIGDSFVSLLLQFASSKLSISFVQYFWEFISNHKSFNLIRRLKFLFRFFSTQHINTEKQILSWTKQISFSSLILI